MICWASLNIMVNIYWTHNTLDAVLRILLILKRAFVNQVYIDPKKGEKTELFLLHGFMQILLIYHFI